MNIENILKQGFQKLNNNNIRNASLDCELLLSKVIKKNREYIMLNLNKDLKKKNIIFFNNLIERRKNGEPVSYLTNKKYFWNEIYYVDKNVLIPRPDTEILVETITKFTKQESKLHILDIGTGSGCILLSILKERMNFTGTGIDISKKSIKISKYNAKKLNLYKRSKFYISDIDNFLFGKYDVIVSNPPYIEDYALKYLDKEVIGYEPKKALKGGKDGLLEITKVINGASRLIKKNGLFVLEIGYNQMNKVVGILKKKGFYIINRLKDYSKNDRCIISKKI